MFSHQVNVFFKKIIDNRNKKQYSILLEFEVIERGDDMNKPRRPKGDNVAILIDFTSHLIGNYHNFLLSQYGITTKQAKVLSYLYHNQDCEIIQKDIEKVFFLRSSTVTSVMGNLEKQGFIERFHSQSDGRVKSIVITPKGNEVQQGIKESLKHLEEKILEGWNEEQKDELRCLLKKVAENMKKN